MRQLLQLNDSVSLVCKLLHYLEMKERKEKHFFLILVSASSLKHINVVVGRLLSYYYLKEYSSVFCELLCYLSLQGSACEMREEPSLSYLELFKWKSFLHSSVQHSLSVCKSVALFVGKRDYDRGEVI